MSLLAPQASEPYLTLATIYEELEDRVKLFQILLIAAHLKRTDQDLWLKCAAMAKKQSNLPMAMKYLSKGITNRALCARYICKTSDVNVDICFRLCMLVKPGYVLVFP